MDFRRMNCKISQYGFRGLLHQGLKKIGARLESLGESGHQLSAYNVISRYINVEGKDVLEIGGAQSCESAIPFLKDGARSVTVSGLQHISNELSDAESGLRVVYANALELSKVFGVSKFDVVYGISIVEHIPSPHIFIEEVFKVLKPGGLAYLQGSPIWSSPKGHHLWVAQWGGAYENKATANFLFSKWPNQSSTNPIPDWAHLLMSSTQMHQYLEKLNLSKINIECILDWIYRSQEINRLDILEIMDIYTMSRLQVLEAQVRMVNVPTDILAALRQIHGSGIDFGVTGVAFLLKKTIHCKSPMEPY